MFSLKEVEFILNSFEKVNENTSFKKVKKTFDKVLKMATQIKDFDVSLLEINKDKSRGVKSRECYMKSLTEIQNQFKEIQNQVWQTDKKVYIVF